MNKVFVFLLCSISLAAHCQSWQWGKRGGSNDLIPINNEPEGVYSLATDSNKNIYGLSLVGYNSLDIDGNPKSNFDSGTSPKDIALFSFGCDGSYRWSKIIGGGNLETVNSVQTDAQNNVYVAGKFGNCDFNSFYPPRIDNDIILNQNPQDCRLLFLAKYSATGVLQWIKRPQAAGVSSTDSYNSASFGFSTDSNGTNYWLLYLRPGTYADGSYVNSGATSQLVIFKYDANGNFIGYIPFDMQLTGGYLGNVKLYRNPHNGYFYFVSLIGNDSSDSAVVGGQTVTHSTFVACFNAQGVFQWKREDTATSTGYLRIFNLEFDSANNIYFGGRIVGLNLENFLGLTVPEVITPNFVMKTDPTASTVLWSSYHNKGGLHPGAISLNGNELGFTNVCYGTDFTWGGQVLNVNSTNQGWEVLLARFNKDTGACIGLTKIPGDIGYDDMGTALTADASGDYILGGRFGHYLYFDNGQQLVNDGQQSDFFIGKYSTQACSPLAVNENEKNSLKVYPNPTTGTVYFDNPNGDYQSVRVYNVLGAEVLAARLEASGAEIVDMSGLPAGMYLLRFEGNGGSAVSKVVKK